ncbi:MAG: hypothetical protein ACKVY0_29025 [Prosthecobacter sp.]|uniref:hypothetical protein n=1 Tax=Prosthecobacter sp. TaxID=1965333 RepID=UPI003901F37E
MTRFYPLGPLVLVCALLSSCVVNRDRFSFVEYSRNPAKYNGGQAFQAWQPSDQLALAYSSNVVAIFRAKATGARVTRELSGSTQVAMSALAGTTAAFNFTKSGIAVLGLGSSLIPTFQGIFNAKGRAEAYADAVRLIETAQADYWSHNQKASDNELTQNGVTLIQRTQATIHVVEKTLSGRIPTIIDLQQATEPMSEVGAKTTQAGTAHNHIPATGKLPELREPTPPNPDGSQPAVASRSATTIQKSILGTSKKLTSDTLPPTVVAEMDKIDPKTKKPDPADPTKVIEAAPVYPRTRAGLNQLTAFTFDTTKLKDLEKAVEDATK